MEDMLIVVTGSIHVLVCTITYMSAVDCICLKCHVTSQSLEARGFESVVEIALRKAWTCHI